MTPDSNKIAFSAIVISVLAYLIFSTAYQATADTFHVNSNTAASDSNPGNGICETANGNGICTLRAAIEEANTASLTVILFDGQYTINDCSLPQLTGGNITINGYSQWDTAQDIPGVRLMITCNNTNILTLNSSNNHIYGLYFLTGSNTTGVTGVSIAGGSNNTIGADSEGHRNVFIVPEYGVENLSNGSNNTISHNYFGTLDGAFSSGLSGTNGIRNISSGNTITDNVIGDQDGAGIHLSGANNSVANNTVGLDKYKVGDLPNGTGIYLEFASNNSISNNTLGANTSYGVWLGPGSNGNDITLNSIGSPGVAYTQGNLSHGIYSTSTGSNSITDNRIGLNHGSGIYATAGTLTITTNTITANMGNGIFGSAAMSIKGNHVTSNQLNGIHFAQTASGTIGGGSYNTPSMANQIGNNSKEGIFLDGADAITISGNWIGTTPGGGSHGNVKNGIFLGDGSNGNIIGGDAETEGNWIAANKESGISLIGNTTSNNIIKNNAIGANVNFNGPLPNILNGITLFMGPHNNTIGETGAGNKIFTNGSNGIYLGYSDNNTLSGNMIGTDGEHNWGNNNSGVSIWVSQDTAITGNSIAFNNSSSSPDYGGILIQGAGSQGNSIRQNSIHNNQGPGINLLAGANGGIAAPLISRSGNRVTGTTCFGCTIEIFSDNGDEGRYFEGSVIADSGGNFTWEGNFHGSYISATATDGSSNSSMFSTPISAPFPWTMFLPAIIR